MSPETQSLFHELVDLTEQERVEYYARHHVDDAVRSELERLFAFDRPENTDSFSVAIRDAAVLALDGIGIQQGSRFGSYRLMEVLGQGGMGTVYRAERADGEITQQVAIKTLHPAVGQSILRDRFLRERELLARLHHPSIARLFDAGHTDEGLPYLVMEYVQGLPIDQFAAGKSDDEKVALMIQVCDAVTHAHQHLIIHRDLKPSNILVESSGCPKLLDFGIAKLLDDTGGSAGLTMTGDRMMTPAYASPEQIRGEAQSTSTDVYSLGAILYKLLTGRSPHESETNSQLAVEIAAGISDVTRPRRLDKGIPADLDCIAMKALDRDPRARYASAESLSADLRRFLTHQPIEARPEALLYRTARFVRRNRVAVALTAVAIVASVAGVVSTIVQARTAERERDRAVAAERIATSERNNAVAAERTATSERNNAVAAQTQAVAERNRAIAEKRRADDEAATAQAVRDFLQNDLLAQATATGQAGQGMKADPDLKVRTALDRAAERIPGKFEQRPLVEAAIRGTIAAAYKEIGLYPEAQRHLERSVELLRRERSEEHPATLTALTELADVYSRRGDYSAARSLHTRVLEIRRLILGDTHRETFASVERLGAVLIDLGLYREAEALHLRALTSLRALNRDGDADAASIIGSLALAYNRQGRYAEAEPLNVRTVDIMRAAYGEEHPRTLVAKNNLSQVYLRRSKFDQSAALQTEVIAAQRRLLGEENDLTLISKSNLAALYLHIGKYVEGEELLVKNSSSFRRVLGEDHPHTLTVLNLLAIAYSRQGKLKQAEETFLQILEKRRRVLGAQHPATAGTMHSLAMVYRQQLKYAEVETLLTEAVDAQRKSRGPEADDTIEDTILLAETRVLQGKYEIQPLLREAIGILERQRSDNWTLHYGRILLGSVLTTQKQYRDAEALLLPGYDGLIRKAATIPTPGRSFTERSGAWIVQLYREWGKPEEARQWQTKLERAAVATTSTQ